MIKLKKSILSEIERLKTTTVTNEELALLEDLVTQFIESKKSKKESKSREHEKSLIEKLSTLSKISADNTNEVKAMAVSIIEAVKEIKLNVEAPIVNVEQPKVEVTVPEIKIPIINVPETKLPTINIPKTTFPKIMSISKPTWLPKIPDLSGLTKSLKAIEKAITGFKLIRKPSKDYITVRLSNGSKFYEARGGGMYGTSGGDQVFRNSEGDKVFPLVDDSGQLHTVMEGKVDDNNSTINSLLADEVFTGTATNVLAYSGITLLVYSDVASASDGVSIQFSPDGTDWHIGETYDLIAGSTKFFTPPVQSKYYRIVYTNGSSDQADFHIHAVLKKQPVKWSSHNIDDPIKDQDDAELVKAVITGKKTNGDFDNVSLTNGANMKVSLEEYDSAFNTNPLPVQITSQDNFTIDSFGRLRVSNTDQRFDAEFIYDKQPFLFNEILTGTGTSTHNTASRDITLKNLSVVDGDGARMIQHWHNPYTPGNSQLIDITGTLNEANIAGGTASIFLLNNSVETEILQSAWDNPVANVNWEFSQIFQMDFQSLKIGRIRFNMVMDGIPTQIHQITNDNIRTGGYWQYPAQPVKWEIYNTATETITEIAYSDGVNGIGFRYSVPINSTQIMRAICTTVKSEGGGHLYNMAGFHFSSDNGVTPITVGTTLIPILSIRAKTTFNSLTNNSIAIPQGFELTTNNPIKYDIVYRPTLTGDSWTDADPDSAFEYDVSATAISGGTKIDSGYVATDRNTSSGSQGILGKTIMSKGNNGTVDILTICAVRTSTSNADTKAILKWKEIR